MRPRQELVNLIKQNGVTKRCSRAGLPTAGSPGAKDGIMMTKVSSAWLLAYFLVFAASMIMTACGGGGGGSSAVVPDEGWVRQFGSTALDETYIMAVDGSGNVYIAGATMGNLDGNTNQGAGDIFLSKYDVLGNRLWTRTLGSSIDDAAFAIAVDGSGNVYIAGYAGDIIPGLQLGADLGGADIVLAKYDGSGNLLWGRQTGTTSNDRVTCMALDGNGGVYIAGDTFGNMDVNVNQGLADVFIMRFDTAGNWYWTRSWGSSGWDEVAGLICNGGYAYIVGNFELNNDFFYTRFDASGSASWPPTPNSTWDGPSIDYISGIAVDGNGNIYIAGSTNGGWGDGYPNTGGFDLFVAKYGGGDINNWLWTRLWGSTADERVDVNCIVVTSGGDVYISGTTSGQLDGNTNQGMMDVFLVKYDTSGNRLWTRTLGSSVNDLPMGLALDGSGNIYIAGVTYGNLEGMTNQGSVDIFGARYDSSGNRLWLSVLGSSEMEYLAGIAVDGIDLYAAGYTNGVMDGTNAGSFDIYLTKYAP